MTPFLSPKELALNLRSYNSFNKSVLASFLASLHNGVRLKKRALENHNKYKISKNGEPFWDHFSNLD